MIVIINKVVVLSVFCRVHGKTCYNGVMTDGGAVLRPPLPHAEGPGEAGRVDQICIQRMELDAGERVVSFPALDDRYRVDRPTDEARPRAQLEQVRQGSCQYKVCNK